MERKTASFYSQFGEDRLLERLLGRRMEGLCIEVGANNGVDGSTTLHFEECGWDCILVEPNPELAAELRVRRKAQIFECAASSSVGTATLYIAIGKENAHAVSALGDCAKPAQILKEHGFVTKPVDVPTRPLNAILEEANPARPIDFISIDVEGHELEMLKGFSLKRWGPAIVIIEDNSPIWESSVRDYLSEQGYVRFRRTGVNDWYAHKTNRALAGPGARLGYYPSMAYSRALMLALRVTAPIAPFLRRVPGMLMVRDLLMGRKAR